MSCILIGDIIRIWFFMKSIPEKHSWQSRRWILIELGQSNYRPIQSIVSSSTTLSYVLFADIRLDYVFSPTRLLIDSVKKQIIIRFGPVPIPTTEFTGFNFDGYSPTIHQLQSFWSRLYSFSSPPTTFFSGNLTIPLDALPTSYPILLKKTTRRANLRGQLTANAAACTNAQPSPLTTLVLAPLLQPTKLMAQ